jgi:hypothetical protein
LTDLLRGSHDVKALGLNATRALLVRADEVIE